MKKNISPELIQKYLRDECTPEEMTEVQDWYEYLGQKDLNEGERQKIDANLKERMFAHVQQRLDTLEPETKVKNRQWIYWLSGVAALLLISLKFFIHTAPGPALSVEQSQMVRVVNNGHTIIKKVLPDHSQVWIKPGGYLSFPRSFTGAKFRTVEMQGEAFFEVTKDHQHPFIIHSDRMTTKVWGTSFRIRALPGSQQSDVVVLTGKVSVQLENAEVMLLPKQKVTFIHPKNVLKKDTATDMSGVQIWQRQSLSFNNTPVNVVAQTLNKAFGVHIIVAGKALGDMLMEADFTNENFPDIMEMIKTSTGAVYRLEGTDIILEKANQ
ncbi:hypothetical protein DBR11_21485 [Pedobacter sp. HMWF019]|uniref:FecR family protein n=1 Tax=Pedobacter sp. HMWF019 TaxID=2056856 RepID=UPI000D397692|nr:FecR family protein [Pedobacter sp. HMWF019]PTS95360.1 hypothetical protein DBR11_21485 [Pedobacter sp. HMWF019]